MLPLILCLQPIRSVMGDNFEEQRGTQHQHMLSENRVKAMAARHVISCCTPNQLFYACTHVPQQPWLPAKCSCLEGDAFQRSGTRHDRKERRVMEQKQARKTLDTNGSYRRESGRGF